MTQGFAAQTHGKKTTGAGVDPGGGNEPMEPNWDSAPDFGRRETLLRALRRLYHLQPGPVNIVETGTLRDDSANGRGGDGWSTVALGWYCTQVGGRLVTVDIDPANLEVSRRVTAPYASAIEYVCAHSLELFAQWQVARGTPIHMLYLDSLDYVDEQASEEHHLAEAEAALPLLAPACLVLIDDTLVAAEPNHAGTQRYRGKGARAIPALQTHGFQMEWCMAGQALLSRD
jgi:predicted O-methyltransferase YrrM